VLFHWQTDTTGPSCPSTLCSHLQLTFGVGLDVADLVGSLQHELAWGADTYPSVLTSSHTCTGTGRGVAAVLVQAAAGVASASAEVTLRVTVLLSGINDWSELRLTLSNGAAASTANAVSGDISVNLQFVRETMTATPLGAAWQGNGSVFHVRVTAADAAAAVASLLRANVADANGDPLPTTLVNFAAAPPPPGQWSAPPPLPPPWSPGASPVAPSSSPPTGVWSLLFTIATGTAVVASLLELLTVLRNRCSAEARSEGFCAPLGKLIRALLDGAISLIKNIANPIG